MPKVQPSKRLISIIIDALSIDRATEGLKNLEDGDLEGVHLNLECICNEVEMVAHKILQDLEDNEVLVAEKPLRVSVVFGGRGGPISKRLRDLIAEAINNMDGDGLIITESDTTERAAYDILHALEDTGVLITDEQLVISVVFGGKGSLMDTPELFFDYSLAEEAYLKHKEECGVEDNDWSKSKYTYELEEIEVK